jgi:hypothetical protein
MPTDYDRDRSPLPEEEKSMIIVGDVDAANIVGQIHHEQDYASFRAP